MCFIKFIIFLIGLVIAIPILFVLSGTVFLATGFIIFCICVFLDKHTNLIEKLLDKLEKWDNSLTAWAKQFRKEPLESSDDEE